MDKKPFFDPDILDDYEFNIGRGIETTLFYHADLDPNLKSIPGMDDEIINLLKNNILQSGSESASASDLEKSDNVNVCENIETSHQLVGKFLSFCKKGTSYIEAKIKFNFWLFDIVGYKNLKNCDLISSCIYYKVQQLFPLDARENKPKNEKENEKQKLDVTIGTDK
jgi:hypothetical protein